MSSIGHLARRFRGSLSRAEPSVDAVAWVHALLLPTEHALWSRMAVQDRRHSIEVARRFTATRAAATPAEVAGALLHDVGKQVAALGTFARVAATVVGPRTERFRQYHDHEALGAAMLREAGSDEATVELVLGHGPAAVDLRRADDL
ncbi:MAG: HD domain-containing protein [Ilumatobacteraceae bacterium]